MVSGLVVSGLVVDLVLRLVSGKPLSCRAAPIFLLRNDCCSAIAVGQFPVATRLPAWCHLYCQKKEKQTKFHDDQVERFLACHLGAPAVAVAPAGFRELHHDSAGQSGPVPQILYRIPGCGTDPAQLRIMIRPIWMRAIPKSAEPPPGAPPPGGPPRRSSGPGVRSMTGASSSSVSSSSRFFFLAGCGSFCWVSFVSGLAFLGSSFFFGGSFGSGGLWLPLHLPGPGESRTCTTDRSRTDFEDAGSRPDVVAPSTCWFPRTRRTFPRASLHAYACCSTAQLCAATLRLQALQLILAGPRPW